MGNGKHISGSKLFSKPDYHKEKKAHTAKLKKTLFVLIATIVIAILIFMGYQYFISHPISFFQNNTTTISDNEIETYEKYIEQIGEASEKVKTTQAVTVKGAEYLEITGLLINSDNPELSTVSATLENLSDNTHNNIDIRITLFDKNNNEITFLDYKIDTIKPHSKASTYAALKRDLSNCKDYTIALKKSR